MVFSVSKKEEKDNFIDDQEFEEMSDDSDDDLAVGGSSNTKWTGIGGNGINLNGFDEEVYAFKIFNFL